jgi:hypothetical protein
MSIIQHRTDIRKTSEVDERFATAPRGNNLQQGVADSRQRRSSLAPARPGSAIDTTGDIEIAPPI